MAEPRSVTRFPVVDRIEHWVLVATFTTLAVTGLAQKYAALGISVALIRFLGGIENTRLIHHGAAVVLLLEAVYHIGTLTYRVFVLHTPLTMLPGVRDVRLALQSFLFNLGLIKARPQQGRYTFEEKLEYWSVVWGTIVMALTGFMMWNPIATTRLFSGEFIPAAKAAHGSEAVLAVLAILVWHIYHVHVRHVNKSMFTGRLTEEEMADEHPLELADLKAGLAGRPVNPQAVARRRRIFFPVYGVVAAGMLVGIYGFINAEHTAISTLPPAERVVVFAPLTPTPFPTAPPTNTAAPVSSAAATWDAGLGDLFKTKCGACHGGPAGMNGLDLSSYQSALKGGQSGPGIVPGKPDESQIIKVQSAGAHPGQLAPQDLALIRSWIENGAPQH
jgi:formate dehydrogenase gamma subunit